MSEFLKVIWVFTDLLFSYETEEIIHITKYMFQAPFSNTGVPEGPSQAARCATELLTLPFSAAAPWGHTR